jgi:cholera toxin transcriptional activator
MVSNICKGVAGVNYALMSTSPDSPLGLAHKYRFGIYEADPRAGELLRDGIKTKLQEQPFQVLMVLLERPGEVVTREELRERLWPADTFVDFDHSLNTAINKLRDALRDSAANPRFIETKAKRGYRFIAPVQLIANGAPEPAATETTLPSAEPAPAHPELPNVHRGWTRTLLALIQVLYLSLYVIALARLGEVGRISDQFLTGQSWILIVLVIVTAVLGIPVRLYLLTAVIFDYVRTGEKFLRIFPAILLLDIVWALAPFLCIETIGIGLALASTAALLYLPFSQRTLVRMTYSP